MKEYEREVEKELSPSTRCCRCEDQRRQSDMGMNPQQTGRFPEVLSTAGLDPHSACHFMKLLRGKEVQCWSMLVLCWSMLVLRWSRTSMDQHRTSSGPAQDKHGPA
ncbi:hypothetical protein DPX16_21276 [Anabarilius grahami]|uniref:Uncharacterized protein n=1 Tax=Anabarilius grahami TaxID=495550 RepID=A0A3N0XUU6_ANAGA|nr:hypothetical protein DPX16_21276 [Anabarilius grahami]